MLEHTRRANGLPADKELPKGWVRLNFRLLETNWQFANFTLQVRLTDPMLIVDSQIADRHGSIKNICLYLDVDRKDKLEYSFTDTVDKVLEGLSGASSTDFTIYYDFENGYSCPLLLF